ncbi:NAD(P)/FAD-dependent oxidoreductase [Trinickia mobilis]|uniref:NAD(P)/FAD-dependent oxidoreductase n=1 Tax=Trinickia mobilis TaxID=2816356 RepID=UPI001A8D6B0F|nr:FAD-dependent oxidoreductase [Trinickia mobilis]
MSEPTIIVAGAGQAGGWAARTLRKEGFAGRVVLVGDEAHPPYERPPLSKAVLTGEKPVESTHLFGAGDFAELSLDWRSSVRITALQREAKRVTLDGGETLRYDALIFCTGGRARELSVPGADLPGVHRLRTLDDALALRPLLQPGVSIVVIGGGWIGLEVAATCRKMGGHAAVVESARRLCERTVPPDVSAYLAELHASHGVPVVLGAEVVGFTRQAGGKLSVTLRDGRERVCDAVVTGVGLIPNDELARAAGIACDGGIIVDEQCRTSDPFIFAAGDVAAAHNAWAGRRLRLESWQNAQEQGICAAKSALGQAVRYQPLPWFWSDQHGVNLQIYGFPHASHTLIERRQPESSSFIRFYLEGHCVKAAIGVDAARDLRFARRLIESRRAVSAESLADASVALSRL